MIYKWLFVFRTYWNSILYIWRTQEFFLLNYKYKRILIYCIYLVYSLPSSISVYENKWRRLKYIAKVTRSLPSNSTRIRGTDDSWARSAERPKDPSAGNLGEARHFSRSTCWKPHHISLPVSLLPWLFISICLHIWRHPSLSYLPLLPYVMKKVYRSLSIRTQHLPFVYVKLNNIIFS